jgi:2-methylcitrate dehydratase PrpD
MAPEPTTSAQPALVALAAELAAFTASGSDAISDLARQRLFDTLGATSIGLATPESRLMHTYVENALAQAQQVCVSTRCRALVAATRSTEIDDIDIASCVTVGSVIVPVALSFAALRPGIEDRALLASIVTGYEAMIRLGRAIDGAKALYRGMWPTYVTAAFGAAATTAKLLSLDAQHMASALALAATRTMSVTPSALAHSGLRYYALGCAAVEGADAALASSAGIAADLSCMETLATRIGADFNSTELTRELGDAWRIGDVDTKMFPTSRQALASIEAFFRQLPTGCTPRDIDAVVVRVPAAYLQMVDRPNLPAQRIESMIGVQYAMALAVLSPDALYDDLRVSLRDDADMRSMMAKIDVLPDDELSAHFPGTWGSTVTVQWHAKAATSLQVLEPSGSGRSTLDLSAIQLKLERILTASGMRRHEHIARLAAKCEALGREHTSNSATALLAELDGGPDEQPLHTKLTKDLEA